ncbi:MAG TPA: DUF4383 domain-containing protein [Rhizomicrobium sp.]|nr:DUF4383 domain-containing protein [Rhizomicrobium sp.]
MNLDTRMAAIVLGVIFVLVGLIGFVPNPIASPAGIFAVNTNHNIVHIVSGVVLLAGAYTGLGPSMALKIIGVIYALVAIAGFAMAGDMMFGVIAMNDADRWFHVFLAILLLASGYGLPAGSARAAAA